MTRRELGSLIFRIAALYLLIQGFLALNQVLGVYLYGMLFSSSSRSLANNLDSVLFSLIPTVLAIVGGWFLMANSDTLGYRFLGGQEGGGTAVCAVTRQEIFAIALSLTGVYLWATAVTGLAQSLSTVAYYYFSSGTNASIQTSGLMGQLLPRILGNLVQFGIGFWLFLSGRGLANLWHWGRTATAYPSPEPPPPPFSPEKPE